MELGGKNPLLVFDDAKLPEALLAAIDGGFFNQGEACTAASRLLVQDNIYEEFTEELCAAVARLRVGDGADPATDVGPLVTRAQQQQVLNYLKIGVKEPASPPRRRCPMIHGWRRILRRTNGIDRRDAPHAGRPGRDLRPGGQRDSVRR